MTLATPVSSITGSSVSSAPPNGSHRQMNPCPAEIDGFLLSDDGNRFTVLSLGSFCSGDRTGDGWTQPLQATYSDANLESVASARLKGLTERTDPHDEVMFDSRDDVSVRTRLFVLARACQALGLQQLAHQLMSHTLAVPDGNTGEQLSIDEFQQATADDISRVETRNCFLNFRDLTISRDELLRRFRWMPRASPEPSAGTSQQYD